MNKNVLIVDDEPYAIDWIIEFTRERGFKPIICQTFGEAFDIINAQRHFAASVIDMNIPIMPSDEHIISSKGEQYKKYHGLLLAHELRDFGNSKHSVIIFTVHDDRQITEIAEVLSIQYIIKGKVKRIKEALIRQFDYIKTHYPQLFM